MKGFVVWFLPLKNTSVVDFWGKELRTFFAEPFDGLSSQRERLPVLALKAPKQFGVIQCGYSEVFVFKGFVTDGHQVFSIVFKLKPSASLRWLRSGHCLNLVIGGHLEALFRCNAGIVEEIA